MLIFLRTTTTKSPLQNGFYFILLERKMGIDYMLFTSMDVINLILRNTFTKPP